MYEVSPAEVELLEQHFDLARQIGDRRLSKLLFYTVL